MGRGWQRHPTRSLVLGHRGARHAAPENTLAAFELAREEGADGVELDVRLDGDGEIIVLHDRTLARVTGGHERRDVELVPSRELSRIDVGGGTQVPRLAQVLQWAAARDMLVDIELKHDVSRADQLVNGVTALVHAGSHTGERILLSCFRPDIVWRLARCLPGMRVAWLVHAGQRFAHHAFGFRLLGAGAVNPEHVLVTPERLARWQRGGALVNVWTVNATGRARRLSDLGVDAIISDEPGKIREALG